MKKCKIYLLLLILFIGSNVFAQIHYSITFDRDSLKMNVGQYEDGNLYTSLKYKDCINIGEDGNPSLPCKYLKFIVPNDPDHFQIEINSIESKRDSISNSILPFQPPIPLSYYSDNKKYPFISPNENIYKENVIYPLEQVRIVNEGYFDGNKRILTLAVSPVQYIGINNQLIFNSKIEFTINFVYSSLRSISSHKQPINRLYSRSSEELLEELSFVENQNDIEQRLNTPQPYIVGGDDATLCYEYMIITNEALAPAFERLVAWKRSKGIDAGVVTMKQVLANPYITKDEVSNLSDDAGKLRQYLKRAYEFNKTKYVLLGGGPDIVPIRYGNGKENSFKQDSQCSYNDAQIPSDLYYSDLNGNWNKDGDRYFGEQIGDDVDFYPELYVGRLLCSNGKEVENYTNKLILYEQNPGRGDFSYLKKAFYSQEEQSQTDRYGQYISSLLPFYDTHVIFENQPSPFPSYSTFPSGKETIDKMNERFGLFSFFGHGHDYNIAVARQDSARSGQNWWWRGITASRQCKLNLEEEGNEIESLTNEDYPAIVYAISCTTTPYDKLTPNLPHNVGQAFTTVGNFGGVAFLGNTRYGWMSIGDPTASSCGLYKSFIESLSSSNYQIGIAEALSKANMATGYFDYWVLLTHNLIGCPEFQIWTDTPSSFQNVTTTYSNGVLSVNTNTTNGKIGVRNLFSSNDVRKSNSSRASFSQIAKNYVVTVYKHNYLPYIVPLYLQNENVQGSYYIFANKVYIGETVDSNKESGAFVIKNTSKVVIETSNEVVLDKGFEVELGASFEIIHKI